MNGVQANGGVFFRSSERSKVLMRSINLNVVVSCIQL